MDENTQNNKPSWKRWNGITLAFLASALLVLCAIGVVSVGGFWLFTRVQQNLADSPSIITSISQVTEEVMVLETKGHVEIVDGDQQQPVSKRQDPLEAGMQVRTGSLSSAILALPDGSQVHLGPEAELKLEQVQMKDERRVFVFSQLSGSSEHDVVAALNKDSRYEVHTSAATGTALGTKFKVQVNPDQSTWFSVLEGEVVVSGKDDSVIVEAGEATLTALDGTPAEPGFFFTGSGTVAYHGETWVIAGQVLQTHTGTTVSGSPLVGDLVFFEGRMLEDGSRLVDVILLLRRSPANRFSITGIVDSMDDTIWMVSGQEIVVTDITLGKENVVPGDLALFEGMILPDGTLQAEQITKLDDLPGLPFAFSGIVEEQQDTLWLISGVTLQTDDETVVDADLAEGDLVQVSGWILEDGTWLAKSILHLADERRAFEFVGNVDSLEPWIVAGVAFETREWTHIDEGIVLDDLVRVSGQILEDGTWVAYDITRLDEIGDVRFVLVGVVTSKQPWIISGITLNVDEETEIEDGITLGMLVRVELQVLPDGTLIVLRIEPLEGFAWELGCQEIVAQLVSFNEDRLQLEGWPEITLGKEAAIPEELAEDSILLLLICFNEDGSIQVVTLFVLFEPPVEEVEEPETPEFPQEKVMLCHKPNGKNPHSIVVSRSAVPAHLGHGDVIGSCP